MYGVPPTSAASHAAVTGTQPLSPPPSRKLLDKLAEAGPALALTLAPADNAKTGQYAAVDFDPSALRFETAAPYKGGGKQLLLDHHNLVPTSFQRVGNDIFIHGEGLSQPIKTNVKEINDAIQSFLKEKNSAVAGKLVLSLLLFDGIERAQLPKEATEAILKRFCTALESGAHPLGALVDGQFQVACAAYVESYMGNKDGFHGDWSRVYELSQNPGMAPQGKVDWNKELETLGHGAMDAHKQAKATGDYALAYDAVLTFESQVFRAPAHPGDGPQGVVIPHTGQEQKGVVDLSAYVTPTGLAQSQEYETKRKITGKLEDGFVSAPFMATLDASAKLKYPTLTKGSGDAMVPRYFEETLVVDRRKDAGLIRHLEAAKRIKAKVDLLPGTDEDRKKALCKELMAYVDKEMGGRTPDASWQRSQRQKPIYLGNVPPGGGVCRHRATLFAVLAGDMGLTVTLRDGFIKTPSKDEGHTWTEVQIGRETYIADAMLFPDDILPTSTDPNTVHYKFAFKFDAEKSTMRTMQAYRKDWGQ